MWPFLVYFDRKIDVYQKILYSEPYTDDNILAAGKFFCRYVCLRIGKILCGFARKNPTTFGATKGTKRAKLKNKQQTLFPGHWQLWGKNCFTKWSSLLPKYLKYDAHTSILLPEMLGLINHVGKFGLGFLVFGLSCRHTGSPPITVGKHTIGAQ